MTLFALVALSAALLLVCFLCIAIPRVYWQTRLNARLARSTGTSCRVCGAEDKEHSSGT
jgi:hypothetical protein